MSSPMRKIALPADHPHGLYLDGLVLTAVGAGEGLQIELTADEAAGLAMMLLKGSRLAAVEANTDSEPVALRECVGHA